MFGFLAMGWIRDVSGSQIAAIIAIVVVWLYSTVGFNGSKV